LKKYLNLIIRKKQEVLGRKYQFEREEKSINVFAIPHPAYRSRNPTKVDKIYEETGLQVREILSKL
jgi:uracil-DNA glycosylase